MPKDTSKFLSDRRSRAFAALIRQITEQLVRTSDTARLDAEILLADALGVSRSDLLLGKASELDQGQHEILEMHISRRLAREPVAYILGWQEFFGLDLAVTPDVLIPRGDSETIVRTALEAAPQARRALDLGTGSGALLLAVLSELPEARGIGIDASPAALQVARSNAAALGLAERATMQRGDWTKPGWADGLGQFDLVLANPPYVEDDADLDTGVRDFEPASALFAGPEGLDDYRIIIPQLAGLLTDSGVAVLEIGATQADGVSDLAHKQGFATQVHQDLAGRDRALVLRLTLGKGESSS